MRGEAARNGERRVAANGYHYVKKDGKWRLTHHVVAEENLGRPLRSDEGVFFKDKDRNNLKPENIGVRIKGNVSAATKRARLEARIAEAQAQLDELDQLEQESMLR